MKSKFDILWHQTYRLAAEAMASNTEFVDEIVSQLSKDTHHCIGVYRNYSFKHSLVLHEDIREYITNNIFGRYGRAMFIDGILIYSGYLSLPEDEKNFKAFIKNTLPTIDKSKAVIDKNL